MVGEVRALPVVVQDVRLADAAREFLGTIAVPNTRRGYAVALNRLCKDFGADSGTAGLDPDRVGGWFTFVWGKVSPQTFNVRLAALRAAFDYWREQGWLAGDPLVRLVGRSVPRDDSRALTRAQVTTVLGLEVALRERVLWQMLYETAARAEEVLMLDVPHLDTANRRAVVTRKGGAKDVVVWQTGTARLLPVSGRPPDRTGVPDRPQGQTVGRPGRRRPDYRTGQAVAPARGRAVRRAHRRG